MNDTKASGKQIYSEFQKKKKTLLGKREADNTPQTAISEYARG